MLPDIIHENQTGYVNDRYMGVRSIYDIMDFTAKENIPGCFLVVSKMLLIVLKCLETFNFGPDFLRCVRVFYKNIQSCVISNGMTSNFFTLERADPLSPYLFVVAVETVAIAIRQNPDIKRKIAIGKEETKLLQYAHDTTAILSDTDSGKTLFIFWTSSTMYQVLRSIPQKPRVHV